MSVPAPKPPGLWGPDIHSDHPRASAATRKLVIALCILVFVIAAAGRIFGPSDLDQNNDQIRTMAFSVDMVVNGNWILPKDFNGQKSRKPPLVNWIGAPIAAMGNWQEWAFKMPALLAALATFLAIAWIGRHLLKPIAGDDATALGWCAAAAWCATPSAVKHIYFLRPDMILIACSTIAWAAAVTSLQRARDGLARGKSNTVFWLFVGLAALAKGPFALLLPLLIPLTSLAWFGSLREARGAGWWWGIPLAGAVFAIWFVPATIENPKYVINVLIGNQVMSRVAPEAFDIVARLRAAVQMVGFFFERFAPFSLAAVAALIIWGYDGLRRSGVMAAAVFPVFVVATIALLGLTGGSYPAPSYPAAAILSVAFLYSWWVRTQPRRALYGVVTVALVTVIAIVTISSVFDRGAVSGRGDAAKLFARHAQDIVGSEPVVFVYSGITAVPSLMGRHQAGKPTKDQKAAARYVVADLDATRATPLTEAHSRDGKWALGLFKAEDVREIIKTKP
jgi:4-amino-4-deoxy-L-arabinose transferase-like glycosyltransferase